MTTLYKNTGKATQVWTIDAVTGGFTISTARNLDGKVTVKFHPVKPKNVGRSNETSIETQTILEIESRIRKQRDKGYVLSLEEASTPATNMLDLPPPMLAKVYSDESHKVDFSKGVFVQPKLDGHRALYKNGVLYSRGGKEINLPHIKDFLDNLGLGDMHLDGEIYYHGKTLQEIGSLIKKPRQESECLVYYVYDIISDKGASERVFDRTAMIVKIAEIFEDDEDSPVQCLKTFIVTSEEKLLAKHKFHLANGFEGTIIRHGTKPYESGKRSDQLLKLKDFSDDEFEVIDVKNGVSIVEGLVLTVFTCLTKDGKEFDVTCHGTAIEKDANFTRDNIGRMLTVKYFGYTPYGIPNLPVAIGWREDV